MPVYKFNGKANEVQSEKLESTVGESSELHLLKDKLPRDDNETPSLKSVDESTTEESYVINANNISPSYEVIDGTTVYFENDPSVQPSFVTQIPQATALPNEQTTVAPNSEIDHESLSSNENTFINNKELQSGTNDTSSNEGIQSSTDEIQKETSSDVPLENPEAIISSTLNTMSKDDISALDENSKPKEGLVENVELSSSAEENAEDNEKEKVTEYVESDGIFASITKTFKMLSNSEETVTTESITTQNSDDIAVPEIAVDSNLQLEEEVSENIGVKNAEEILPPNQMKLESSINQSFIDKEKVETQQEIIPESIENAKVSDEKIKEASTIILENTTSSSDVPLSNNFVHENADKPAKELQYLRIPSVSPNSADDNSAPAKADVENIQIQETSQTEKVEDTRTDDAIISDKEDSTILSNLQETVASIQSSDDIEQKVFKSDKAYLENTKKDYQETISQTDKTVIAENSEIINSPPETIESFPESHSVSENIPITEEALNHSTADIQFNKEFIVHNNVNKNDNLVNDSSDNVPTESNEFSNTVKSSVLGPEQSVDSSQESMISEQTMTLNEILKKRDLSAIKKNLKQQDSKLLININIEKF